MATAVACCFWMRANQSFKPTPLARLNSGVRLFVMASDSNRHSERQERWLRLAPIATRYLCTGAKARVLPGLALVGFRPVECSLGNPEWPVSAQEIEVERRGEGFVDSIAFNFDKYRRPRFQVHAARRSLNPPHQFIRSGNLVVHPSQYYHYWGRPWWLPTALWSQSAASSTLFRVSQCVPQLLEFLDSGARGCNVSRQPQ